MCSLHWKIGAVFDLPDTIVKSSDETIYSSISAPRPSCRLKLKITKSPLGGNNQQGHRSAGNISSPSIQSLQDHGRGWASSGRSYPMKSLLWFHKVPLGSWWLGRALVVTPTRLGGLRRPPSIHPLDSEGGYYVGMITAPTGTMASSRRKYQVACS